MDEKKLRNADLSHLRVQDMTPEQRAEIRRRYEHFVRNIMRRGKAAAGPQKTPHVAKWTPGRRPA
jgi:hypothetical protein